MSHVPLNPADESPIREGVFGPYGGAPKKVHRKVCLAFVKCAATQGRDYPEVCQPEA